MEKDWKLVKAFAKAYLADIALEVLAENNISGVILNKKDSSYMSFGDVEVYVHESNIEKAIKLLEELN